MRRKAIESVLVLVIVLAGGNASPAQGSLTPPAAVPASSTTQSPQPAAGGRLHGVVKSGNTPLPGVTVTAQNTLTGKRYSTTTGITGAWSLNIPLDGRYVIRTQFAAFAQAAQEALLNASNRDRTANFDLILASRAAAQQENEQQGSSSQQVAQTIRQFAGDGAQNLNLMNSLEGDTEIQDSASGMAGAALPSIAGDAGFSADSLAITGQTGQVSPLAGLDMDRIRDAIETARLQNGGQPGERQGILVFGGPGGFSASLGGPGGGFMGGRGGGFGGGRMIFRNFNPAQPHGAIFWTGSNSALDALPFALNGQPQIQPASGTNRFGITFISAPYLPHLTKPSGKDTVFLTLSGSRDSSPLDQYAVVPTDTERRGDFSAAGLPVIADPANDTLCRHYGATPGQPFPGNVIPSPCIAAPAVNLLRGNSSLAQVFPEPNLAASTASGYNYHLLTTAQTNNTLLGFRYMRALGKDATLRGSRGFSRRSRDNPTLRQSIHFNYNWSHSAQDNVNLFPLLGGNSATDSNSLQMGYTLGYHKITSIFNASWNRANAQTLNYFTNRADVATQAGILGPGGAALNVNPLDYGLPGVTLGQFTGLNQQQPNFSLSQTIAVAETLSWRLGKHNIRFGGDYHRVHRNFLGGSNSTGSFTFSGKFTQYNGDDATGLSLADFLLGLPQSTAIDVAAQKSYLRQNIVDLYALDDWRVKSNLTLNYGLRYEFFAPFTEKYNHLAFVDTNPLATATAPAFAALSETQAGGAGAFSGALPSSLVFPFRIGLAPRAAFALRLPKQTVLRTGFGINFTNSQYATFATAMARQPMVNQPALVNEQTNIASAAGAYTLTDGFPSPDAIGSYALDPHYRLPYVEVWNVDIQKTLPWGVVMNVGYNGSRGNHLDITSAPRATLSSPGTDPGSLPFNYEQAVAASRFNAGTLRLNKRLSGGIALGADYQYSHSIDNAGSIGGTSTVVAQNWQDLAAEEGNSSFDQRHKVSGIYLFELPFGQDKRWLTSGAAAHIFEGFSISGSFTFATGTPLTPSYTAAVSDVAHGTAGTLRPNLLPSVSPTAGGGSLKKWFNTAAYSQPAPDAFGNAFGNASRNSIPGPGTVQNNMSLSKTMQLGETRSMELRASANNVFNTVQYSGVDTRLDSATAGQVTSAAAMRSFQFIARFRF